MSQLPSGTVTFLFTDIEGSTRLWDEDPVGMEEALARHDEILRGVIEAHGGHVFSTAGDAFSAAFSHAQDAVETAVGVQRGLTVQDWGDVDLRVRIAAHTGEAEERDGDYFGPALNRAARVLAAGHGGQVLVTATTCELVAESGLADVDFVDLGSHRLRDLSAPEHLFQVVADGLSSRFPPLRSLGAFTHNLPVQLTSFVGRGAEMEKVGSLLEVKHHVSVVGPGGAGKTRLAVQVAGERVEDCPDGVWYVDLRDISDPTQVGSQVASTLRIQLAGDKPAREQVVDALWWRQLLLILDNCEHVVTETAWLVGEFVQRGGEIRTLATTRQPLGIPDEPLLWLDPLPLPDAGRLFIDRALIARPHFTVDEHAESVYQICQTLEGLPLAIELAAARLRVLSPQELADRLDDHLTVLRSSQTTGDLRHATMEATIDWSWHLLTEAEQVLFTRLSLFPASFNLDTAEQICGFDPLHPSQILDLITSLADKSLLTVEDASADTTRYRMLEPIRQYAETKLDQERTDQLRQRHVDYWTSSLPKADQFIGRRDEEMEEAALLEPDQANVTTAVEWAFQAGRPEDAMRILGSRFGLLLQRRTQYELAAGWMDQALEHRAAIPTPVLLDALRSQVLLRPRPIASPSGSDTKHSVKSWRGPLEFEPGSSSGKQWR